MNYEPFPDARAVEWDYFPPDGRARAVWRKPLGWSDTDTVPAAFTDFGNHCIPPNRFQNASIIDSTGAILIAYAWVKTGLDWTGTAFGFELLCAHPDVETIDVMFWEMKALGTLPAGVEL